MKEALKFIGLSFFSDKIAGEAPKRGIRYIFIAAIISLLFAAGGLIMAYVLPFKTMYLSSPYLAETVQKTFSDGQNKVSLSVSGGRLKASAVVDTRRSDGDKKAYFAGADIVVDTRSADTLDDFTAYCVGASGKEITYEQYLELDSDVRSLYTFKIRYSGNELVIDDALINRCEGYLDTDKSAAEKYDEIKKLNREEYGRAVYELYVAEYYPDLKDFEPAGGAPKLRNYYYYNYGTNSDILFVFDDSMAGVFTCKNGSRRTVYGLYSGLMDGEVDSSAAGITAFMLGAAKGGNSYIIYRGLFNFFLLAPFLAVAVIAISALALCIYRLKRIDRHTFFALCKTACAFTIVSSLIAALGTFALGFAVAQELLNWLEGILFFGVLLARMLVTVIKDCIKTDRERKAAANKELSEGGADCVVNNKETLSEVNYDTEHR